MTGSRKYTVFFRIDKKAMDISLKFLGAAGTVTGSKYLLKAGARRILIDCGMFQCLKERRLFNRESLPVDPGT
ncbi:MAG: hypothetical protein ACKOAR_05965, partial [Bacteroidota bacterium]